MPTLHRPSPDCSKHISQSECKTAMDCGALWFAEWWHALKRKGPESQPMRVGTLGHALVAYELCGLANGDNEALAEYLRMVARHRGYDADTEEFANDCRLAGHGVNLLAEEGLLSGIHPARTIIGDPLIENRMTVPWGLLEDHDGGMGLRTGLRLHPHTVDTLRTAGRLGIEGVADVVHHEADVDVITDWKFRSKVDLGGQASSPHGVDPQGAYYRIIHEALNLIGQNRPVVFRQVSTYAGPWITVDDFLNATPGDSIVLADGLPTRDTKRLAHAVTAAVWDEAFRLLVARRLERGGKAPTPRQMEDAHGFIATLRSQRLTHVATFPVPADAARECVRDMLTAVAAHTALALQGVTPGRHFRSHQSAPCQRPWGCNAQTACHASLGADNFIATIRSMQPEPLLNIGDIADHE